MTKNVLCTPITLPHSNGMVHSAAGRIVTRSLQITSFSSRWDHSVAAGGEGNAQTDSGPFGGLRAVYVW